MKTQISVEVIAIGSMVMTIRVNNRFEQRHDVQQRDELTVLTDDALEMEPLEMCVVADNGKW